MSIDKMIDMLIAVLVFAGIIGTVITQLAVAEDNTSGAIAVIIGLVGLLFAIFFLRGLNKASK